MDSAKSLEARLAIAASVAALMLTGCKGTDKHQATEAREQTAATSNISTAKATGDGPFGLPLSGKASDFDFVSGDGSETGIRMLKSVPKPADGVIAYGVEVLEGAGLCRIRAIGPTNEHDDTGVAVRTQIEEMAASLQVKYGTPQTIDRCIGGVMCEAQFWTMAVDSNERFFIKEWQLKSGPVSQIDLAAYATTGISNFYALDYMIGDQAKCKALRSARKANNL